MSDRENPGNIVPVPADAAPVSGRRTDSDRQRKLVRDIVLSIEDDCHAWPASHRQSTQTKSRLAIVVTDGWDPKLIEESRQDLLAIQENGLQIVVLLANGNTLSHLPEAI